MRNTRRLQYVLLCSVSDTDGMTQESASRLSFDPSYRHAKTLYT